MAAHSQQDKLKCQYIKFIKSRLKVIDAMPNIPDAGLFCKYMPALLACNKNLANFALSYRQLLLDTSKWYRTEIDVTWHK